LYRIRDHYFRFWFRFMFPNMSFLEEHGPKALVEQRIAPTVADHVAGVFEEVVTAVLRAMNKAGRLPFQFERFGRWWSSEAEIDVLGLSPSESALLACECKWASRPVGTDVLRSLAAKVEALGPPYASWRRVFALASRAGFTDALRREAEAAGNVVLVDLETIGTLAGEQTRQPREGP
ncbi:MAG: hypothetical protein FJ279_27230, partial [Planctomycetes bacterium]|nr:hypothetical protein [Planctomycetota bacterium]